MPGRLRWRSGCPIWERASFKWYNIQSQHAMSGTLYVVATPIGNLEDITLRALRVLREADLIAAEDTRRTSRLLAHFGITTKMVSLHEHSQHRKIAAQLDRVRAGSTGAVVTDAGMPVISDPGRQLTQEAVASGIEVQIV